MAYSISSIAEAGERALSFSREIDFYEMDSRCLTNGAFIVTHGGMKLATAAL